MNWKVLFYAASVFILAESVWAGKGVIPLAKNAIAYQHVERAIVLWNGREEIIVIANDIAASDEIPVLELMPFGSRPQMRIGKVEWFRKAFDLTDLFKEDKCEEVELSEYLIRMESALQRTILPTKMEVWETRNFTSFEQWLMDTLRKAYCVEELPTGFIPIMLNYFNRRFRFWGVDYVDAGLIGRMVSPIEYRFPSKRFYYPTMMTSANSGPVTLVVFAVTHKPITFSPMYGMTICGPIKVRKNELTGIHDEINKFFGSDTVYFTMLKFSGQAVELKFDLLCR